MAKKSENKEFRMKFMGACGGLMLGIAALATSIVGTEGIFNDGNIDCELAVNLITGANNFEGKNADIYNETVQRYYIPECLNTDIESNKENPYIMNRKEP